MISTFSGLNTATRGLYASQIAESVTTNNISNANTEGYSRKTISQTAVGPAAIYIKSTDTGSGSEVTSISRTRSALLDQKYWKESGVSSEWTTKASYLMQIEDVMQTTDTSGYSMIMDKFYSSLEDLSTDPSSAESRTAVQQAGVAVCDYINSMASSISKLRDDVNAEVKTTVEEINSYSTQIAKLNQQIQRAAAGGADASDLEDQRGIFIDKLSMLVKIDVSLTKVATSATGDAVNTLNISIHGGSLVLGNTARKLECDQLTGSSDSTKNGMIDVRWSDTQKELTSSGGQLGALLELRDGTGINSDYKGILYYSNQLDDFARTFAETFNEGTTSYSGHIDGYGEDDSTGNCFFSFDGKSSTDLVSATDRSATNSAALIATDYKKITAANISLSSDVLDDTAKIATSSASGEAENNNNLLDLIQICEGTEMFGNTSPTDEMNSIVATLGTASSYASVQATNQKSFLSAIDTLRNSVSGVSTNEESTNLVVYQKAYSASAKAVSMWQEIFADMLDMVNSN